MGKYKRKETPFTTNHVKDIRGQRFGKLVVKEFHHSDGIFAYWLCECDCGNATVKSTQQLRQNWHPSCGCNPRYTNRPKRNNVPTHHMTGTRLYKIWKSMRSRCGCKNPNRKEYWGYPHRGITICDEWNDFENFYKWAMENGYDPDAPKGECTLDRIDVNGNYEPSNCRWATNTQQVRNRRKTVYLVHNGERKPLTEWCEILGLNKKTVYGRLHNYGWTNPEEILFGKGDKRRCQGI